MKGKQCRESQALPAQAGQLTPGRGWAQAACCPGSGWLIYPSPNLLLTLSSVFLQARMGTEDVLHRLGNKACPLPGHCPARMCCSLTPHCSPGLFLCPLKPQTDPQKPDGILGLPLPSCQLNGKQSSWVLTEGVSTPTAPCSPWFRCSPPSQPRLLPASPAVNSARQPASSVVAEPKLSALDHLGLCWSSGCRKRMRSLCSRWPSLFL